MFFVDLFQNNISVYCPGLTDGSLGDMLYFHSFRNPGLIIDIVQGMDILFQLSCMLVLNKLRNETTMVSSLNRH
jgi:deoxyhypusine synthase